MKSLKNLVIAIVIGISACQAGYAQDYVGMLDQMIADIDRQNAGRAQMIVQSYRQQTGDWNSSPQQILAMVEAQSRMNNPAFYANLRQREANFQRQQANYTAHANEMLDMSFNGYMNRSAIQHQGHQNYVRGAIWEQGLYTDGSNVVELPNYAPGSVYESGNGYYYTQDNAGQYHQFDNSGWGTEMDELFGG